MEGITVGSRVGFLVGLVVGPLDGVLEGREVVGECVGEVGQINAHIEVEESHCAYGLQHGLEVQLYPYPLFVIMQLFGPPFAY